MNYTLHVNDRDRSRAGLAGLARAENARNSSGDRKLSSAFAVAPAPSAGMTVNFIIPVEARTMRRSCHASRRRRRHASLFQW